jgi:2-polyprenyl-3-methyl-5-hydroxy-6-metoxy-1,4-benzoquinol methylase
MKRFLNSTKVPGKLLDIGCSTGVFLNSAIKKGWMVEGVEVSESAGRICKKNTGANVFIGKVEDFQSEHKFDAITAWEVLEHIPYPIDFIGKTKNLLHQGGIMCLSVPNWDSPWTKNSKLTQHWPPYHLSFWNLQSLKSAFPIEDFDIVDIREKPFAWSEEVGNLKWLYFPISLIRSIFLHQKGMHIYIKVRKK